MSRALITSSTTAFPGMAYRIEGRTPSLVVARHGRSDRPRNSHQQKVEEGIPTYRIHKAKNLGYVRMAGRMIYLGRAGSAESHEQYRRVVAEWLVTGRAPAKGADSHTVSVTTLVDDYLTWARKYYRTTDGSPSSGLGNVEAAGKALCGLYGSTPAAAFGPVALRAVRESMILAGLCRNVINARVACVKRIFRWAVADERVPSTVLTALCAVEPLRKGRSGARETEPVRPVPDEHVDLTIQFLPPSLRAMVQLQRLTGMRSGELCILRPCDIDRSGKVWIYRPASHKTAYRGHDRTIVIGPRAQALLRSLLKLVLPEAYVFSPVRALEERGRHARMCGNRYNPRSYHRALRYAMRQAVKIGAMSKNQFWHPHQLRHLYATAVRRIKGLEAARELLGHRTLAQTLDYAEVNLSFAGEVAAELG